MMQRDGDDGGYRCDVLDPSKTGGVSKEGERVRGQQSEI